MVETLPWSISMTPNMFMPSLETAYSSAATPIFRSPKVSTKALTTSACGIGLWVAVPKGVGTKASSSRVSFPHWESNVISGIGLLLPFELLWFVGALAGGQSQREPATAKHSAGRAIRQTLARKRDDANRGCA